MPGSHSKHSKPLTHKPAMLKKRYTPYYLFFKPVRLRTLTTCPLPLDPPTISPSATAKDHKSLCLSLVDDLIRRGRLPSAQKVIQRIISSSPSVASAISAVDFATMRGMDLDSRSYGVLIGKLVSFGEHGLAEVLYSDNIVCRGIDPASELLNSMVICYCTLGKLEEAKTHFDRLIDKEFLPSKAACNALLRELCAQERVLEAFDYFIGINDSNIHLGFWYFDTLIHRLCCKGYLDEALYIFDKMRERSGYAPAVHLYKFLVYELCKRGRVEEAEFLCSEMEANVLFIDKLMYTSLIREYCRVKKMKMAMRVFLRMLKRGCDPDTYTYNTLIHGFFKLGLFDKGWLLYDWMVELGLQPNMVTYHIMISRYCKGRQADCAIMVLNNMISRNLLPSVHCFCVLIDALYEENRSLEADDLYQKMLDSGVVPDHVLFFILMKRYPGHELLLAKKMLQEIARYGCGFEPSLLSSPTRTFNQEIELLIVEIVRRNKNLANVAFGIFISALCVEKNAEVSMLCMEKMLGLGCRPLLSTCNSLIKCLFQEGLVENAKSLINDLQNWGMVPNLETYLIMVNEHCNQRDLASAFDVLDQMDDRGLRPGVAIYDSIIGCLSTEKRIFEAEIMFKRMLEAGVDPDEVVYITMINGYSKNGRAFEARQLFDKMIEHGIEPSSRAYTALINGLVKKNMTEKAYLYLDRMLEDGFVPDTVLYTSLINQFLRKGELEFTCRLIDLMERSKIECDLVTWIVLVNGFCRNINRITTRRPILANRNSNRGRDMLFHLLEQNAQERRENILSISTNSSKEITFFALKLVWKIKDSRFMPNLYLYNGMISGFCRAGKMPEAYCRLGLMQKQDICLNQVTFTILIDGHIRSGDIDRAIELFNKMNLVGCAPDKIAYNALLKGLCKAGRLLDALSLSFSMHKRGFFPNKASCEFLLNSLCASCLSMDAFNIFEEMLAHHFVPCRYNYNWLLCILCEDNKLHEAQIVHDMMLKIKRGRSLDEVTKELLLEACYKQREVD
ncbi:hypothetical protein L1049_020797 [Liquidambar formosana]|uniref:Pentatricopeptide repeat-containing protein n=1 Tax=Liquidambar formosana TaxID=63359 RepID=A0AAP0SD91_LIQFO